jgi:multimeric flavodoxin WrbA
MNAVLLVGSPRGDRSVSKALGDRLLRGLAAKGAEVDSHSLHAAHGSSAKTEAWLAAADKADLLIFAFPLYVDQLPAPVILALDRLAERRRVPGVKARVRLAALVQFGFLETHQNRPALEIMKTFAKAEGLDWAGDLAMGMGGAVSGRTMPEKPAGMLRNLLLALDEAAAALADGRAIPDTAIAGSGFHP